jgi:hypothetical protein
MDVKPWHRPHFRSTARYIFREQRNMAQAAILRAAIPAAALLLALVPMNASAKDTRFWNLTANTITSLQLSPPGKNEWGRNQTDNDDDHTVDHDERLKITGTEAGVYDVKFVDKRGRSCVVPNVQVKTGAVFSIDEKELKDCTK